MKKVLGLVLVLLLLVSCACAENEEYGLPGSSVESVVASMNELTGGLDVFESDFLGFALFTSATYRNGGNEYSYSLTAMPNGEIVEAEFDVVGTDALGFVALGSKMEYDGYDAEAVAAFLENPDGLVRIGPAEYEYVSNPNFGMIRFIIRSAAYSDR